MGLVVTVSGAVGGIGTSTFAYALALQQPERAVLIDAQPAGTPLDLLIGAEAEPGTRWRHVHVTADIGPETIRAALPSWQRIRFLSADRERTANAAALLHLVSALRADDLVILDIDARNPVLETLQPDLRVLLVPTTIYGLGAALCVEGAVPVLVETMPADFSVHDFAQYLPGVATFNHELAVWQLMRETSMPPLTSSVMRAAAAVMQHAGDR